MRIDNIANTTFSRLKLSLTTFTRIASGRINVALDKTQMSLVDLANMNEAEVIDYLREFALQLSDIALEAKKPKASALLILAASNLKTGTDGV